MYLFVKAKNTNHIWWYLDGLQKKETIFLWKKSINEINNRISYKSPFDQESKRFVVFVDYPVTTINNLADEDDEIYIINIKYDGTKSENKLYSDPKIKTIKIDFKGVQDERVKNIDIANKKEFIEEWGNENPFRIEEYHQNPEIINLYSNEFDYRMGIKLIEKLNTPIYFSYWKYLDRKTLYAFFINPNDLAVTGLYKVLTGANTNRYGLCPPLWFYYEMFASLYMVKFKANPNQMLKLFATWVYLSSTCLQEKYKEGWKSKNKVYYFQPSKKSIQLFYSLIN